MVPAVQRVNPVTESGAESTATDAPKRENNVLKIDGTRLTVDLDAETNTFIYKSVNPTNGEVVWQWPSEKVMRVLQYFRHAENLETKDAKKHALDQKA